MFGDIVTDLGAALQGGLGMAASGNIHPGRVSMFEPVHGSAPPLAGKDVANPLATLLSFAMLLRYSFALGDEADLLEQAVKKVLADGVRTADIATPGTRPVSTTAMGDAVVGALDRLSA